MCKECGKQICPPSCPEFDHFLAGRGKAETHCQLCGGAIYRGEKYYRKGDVAVCSDCEKCMTFNEIRILLGTKEALVSCGFETVY